VTIDHHPAFSIQEVFRPALIQDGDVGTEYLTPKID
jgi:hypothetical protein